MRTERIKTKNGLKIYRLYLFILYICNFGQLASHKSLILFYECSLNIAFKIFDTYRLLYVAGTYHETAVFVTALCVGWLAENLKIHIHYI